MFSRIHVNNLINENGGGFFQSYTVKSLKKKNSVLITPKKMGSLIEDLKVLIDLNNDATFKLIQSSDNEEGVKKQYIEITGHCTQYIGSTFKSYIEVNTIFQENLYPVDLEPKDVEF